MMCVYCVIVMVFLVFVVINGYDVDCLLVGYCIVCVQEILFDLWDGLGVGYDEFVDDDGNV